VTIIVLELNTNEQHRVRGQRITEVAWEDAGGSRGLNLEPQEKKEGGGRVDANAREDENQGHDNFIQVHATFLSNKNALEACEKKRIHVGQQK
jgi:hypothetical protein